MGLLSIGRKRRNKAETGRAKLAAAAFAALGAATLVKRRRRAHLFGKGKAAVNAVTPSATPEYDDVTLARKVDGVQEVNNLLHLKGTEPITKTEGKVRSVATR